LFVLKAFRRLMQKGFLLQKAIIQAPTENGQRLAQNLEQNQDIRSGVSGFNDDPIGRKPETVAKLPLRGNSVDLERL
ncbi:undecaprenyl-phosphate glucose phosphotransferase, partial [Pseudomonas sp. CCI4.2]|uniref:nucleoside-diphosphate sugar epimerase/dehydratase n=1 Tax=Pseudomonas sp. CCI4.2 TaxID=3048620 RepID=UPI002B38B917|nr:undecaprenyl-phosphate glucose phosphotransferase [Pseudomonas sp. CCI4.2]